MFKRHTICANEHDDNSFTGIHINKKYFEWELLLKDVNKYPYKPGTAKCEQINKLYGFTVGILRFRDEFRFGWRANKEGKIELFAYHYVGGVMPSLSEFETKYKIGEVEFNDRFTTAFKILDNEILFILINSDGDRFTKSVQFDRKIYFGWILGLYNGGGETYDNDFHFYVKKIK
jgi:hypothetical protein